MCCKENSLTDKDTFAFMYVRKAFGGHCELVSAGDLRLFGRNNFHLHTEHKKDIPLLLFTVLHISAHYTSWDPNCSLWAFGPPRSCTGQFP